MKLYTLTLLSAMTISAAAQAQSAQQPQPVVIHNTRSETALNTDEKPYKRNMTWYLNEKPQRLVLRYEYKEGEQLKRIERTLDVTNTTQSQRDKMIQDVEDRLPLPKDTRKK